MLELPATHDYQSHIKDWTLEHTCFVRTCVRLKCSRFAECVKFGAIAEDSSQRNWGELSYLIASWTKYEVKNESKGDLFFVASQGIASQIAIAAIDVCCI